jgi:hypothetical protein
VSGTVRRIGAVLFGLSFAAAAGAQPPLRVTNGTVTAQPAGSPLVPFFERLVTAQADVAWIGYTVPVADGHEVSCDWSGVVRTTGPVRLEGGGGMTVLFRIAERRVEKVRVFSDRCEFDAGGRPVQWLNNVDPAESVRLLETIATTDTAPASRSRVSNGALVAMALHGGSGKETAAETLIRLARSARAPGTRSDALFWLAQMAGTKAGATITERIEQDPDTDVKKKAVFALSQLPKDEGVPLLIKVARTNANPVVRKQAMFWLGQSQDPRAIDFFAEILK